MSTQSKQNLVQKTTHIGGLDGAMSLTS